MLWHMWGGSGNHQSRRVARAKQGKRKSQPARGTHRLAVESLEVRRLLTANLYLDFGDNFPAGGLQMTAGQLQDIFDTQHIVDVLPGAAGAASIQVLGDIRGGLTIGDALTVQNGTGVALGNFTISGESYNATTGIVTISVNEAIANGGTVDVNGQTIALANNGIQGPSLIGRGNSANPIAANTVLTFSQMANVDYNGDGASNAADYSQLRADVVELVQRYYAPFDINVQIAPAVNNASSATYIAGLRTQLQQGLDANGERDTWAFISAVTRVDGGATVIVGDEAALNGIAAAADIPGAGESASPNARDDCAIVFADHILSRTSNAFQADTRLAYTAAHEPGHTFGLWHTWNGVDKPTTSVNSGAAGAASVEVRGNVKPDLVVGNTVVILDGAGNSLGSFTIRAGSTYSAPTGTTKINVTEAIANGGAVDTNARTLIFTYTTDQSRIVASDIIPGSVDNTNRVNFDFFSRSELLSDYAVTFGGDNDDYSPYDILARTENLGLRANSAAYVTGTGAFDRITVSRVDAITANVTVEAFREATFTNQIRGTLTYLVSLVNDILLEGGFGDDLFLLDGDLNAKVTVHGMAGSDRLTILGKNADTAVYTPGTNTEDGLDEEPDLRGTIVIDTDVADTLTTQVDFEEFENTGSVTIQDVKSLSLVTPLSSDSLEIDSPAADRNRITGFSGAVAIVPLVFFNAASLTVDTGTNDGIDGNDGLSVTTLPLVATGLKNLTINTGDADDLLELQGGDFRLPVADGAFTYNAGAAGMNGNRVVVYAGSTAVDFTLSDASLTSSGKGKVELNGVTKAELYGSNLADKFTFEDWTGSATAAGNDGDDEYVFRTGSDSATYTVNEFDAQGDDTVDFSDLGEPAQALDWLNPAGAVTETSLVSLSGGGTVDVGAVNQQLNIEYAENARPYVDPVEGDTRGVPQEPIPYSVRFVDVGTKTTHTAVITWGDGQTDDPATVVESAEPSVDGVVQGTHEFMGVGTYTVQVALTNDGGVSAAVDTKVTIRNILVKPDLNRPGQVSLYVGGTNNPDAYVFLQRPAGDVVVSMTLPNYYGVFQPSANGAIYVFTCDGNDLIRFSPLLTYDTLVYAGAGSDVIVTGSGDDFIDAGPGNDVVAAGNGNDTVLGLAGNDVIYGQGGDDRLEGGDGNDLIVESAGDNWLIGGDGNDRLVGGIGNDILLGGLGNDILSSSLGRNLLIGGEGRDYLFGTLGQNVLIAGTTDFDGNDAALTGILQEWSSATSYGTRIAHLSGSIAGGLNNGFLLNNTTVHDDLSVDYLLGGSSPLSGANWYFARQTGDPLVRDIVLRYWTEGVVQI